MSEEKDDVAQMWDGQEMGSEGKHGRPWRASGPDLDLILKGNGSHWGERSS